LELFIFNLFCFLIGCHFIGDFPFQSEFLACNKGKSWEINFYHAITYTSVFIVFGKVSIAFAALLLITHFIVDPLKARYKLIKSIWLDQLIHIAIIFIGVLYSI
jgi:hypothetical protein